MLAKKLSGIKEVIVEIVQDFIVDIAWNLELDYVSSIPSSSICLQHIFET